mmetsp:Transcript_70888/g.200072  ORF Transcript_70888/g.200072 Transcript_70888/m.200072 type:complete len:273 (-) Transcript_70888:207-1025(-)
MLPKLLSSRKCMSSRKFAKLIEASSRLLTSRALDSNVRSCFDSTSMPGDCMSSFRAPTDMSSSSASHTRLAFLRGPPRAMFGMVRVKSMGGAAPPSHASCIALCTGRVFDAERGVSLCDGGLGGTPECMDVRFAAPPLSLSPPAMGLKMSDTPLLWFSLCDATHSLKTLRKSWTSCHVKFVRSMASSSSRADAVDNSDSALKRCSSTQKVVQVLPPSASTSTSTPESRAASRAPCSMSKMCLRSSAVVTGTPSFVSSHRSSPFSRYSRPSLQ